MHLKKIEFLGFKSFAAKTVMEFPVGVTAIVGPNGSGKSNVIDGLRWVLGERDAKNIRADKSESLIFSGTAQRSRGSMAEVTITLDNSTKFFPIDYTEVTIRRRITRGGTSQYFLNEAEVRLKDVIAFFSQARLGARGFSIINQGSSDLFLSATPSERRMMMEEILGLRQYQIKRHDAEKKLESTQVNADKVASLIEELLPHLRLLRRQAKKWEAHGDFVRELRDLENKFFSFKLKELGIDEAKVAPQIEQIDTQRAVKEKELSILEAELKAIEQKQPQGDAHFSEFKKKQAAILTRRSTIQKELGRLEAELEFIISRPKTSLKEAELAKLVQEVRTTIESIISGTEDAAAIRQRLHALVSGIDRTLRGEVEGMKERQQEIAGLKQKFVDELSQLEENLAQLGELEQKLAGDMREFNVVFKKAFAAVEAKRSELRQLESQKQRLGFDLERIQIKRTDLAALAAQYNRTLSEFTAYEVPEGFDIGGAERRILKLRGDLASIGEIDESLLKEAKEAEERYAFLTQQLEDLKKAIIDLKVLIRDLTEKLHGEFTRALTAVNEEFNKHFRVMFNGGKAKLHLVKREKALPVEGQEEGVVEGAVNELIEEAKEEGFDEGGLEIELSIPRKNIKGLDMLSGGERSLVSIAAIFALISVSPPPFLVLDEVDAALDENNTRRFADLVGSFSKKTQFIIVTHNRSTMSAAEVLYGVTMGQDGTSRVLSIKLEDVHNELLPQKA